MAQTSLFFNYLKLGFRNLRKNLIASSINIAGLAIAIGIAITTYVFVDYQLHMNRFHSKGDRIYQVLNFIAGEENPLWGDTPLVLGPRLLEDHPAVEQFTRVEYTGASVRYKSNVFDESMIFVDPAYMEMFDFEILAGSRTALQDKKQVILSYDMAVKYFGSEDPLGKELIMNFGGNGTETFTVGAVMEDYPYNSGMNFDFLLPINNFLDRSPPERNGWSYFTDATFVLLAEGHSMEELEASFDDYVRAQNSVDPEWLVERFTSMPFYDLATEGFAIVSGVVLSTQPAGRIALSLLASFLLGMACFNFMNIAIAGATRRLREIALRKVMGGVRSQIVQQFMVENLLLCFISLVAGIGLAYYFFVPAFDYMVPELDFEFRSFYPIHMLVFFVCLLFITAVLSGAYPAFYISKFLPVTIFKGNTKLGSQNLFSRIVLGIQFFLAFQTIVGGFVFTDISYDMTVRDWGYDQKNTLSVAVQDASNYELMKNALLDQPKLDNYAGASGHVGRYIARESFEYLDKKFAIRRSGVTNGYLDVLGFRLIAGRFFDDQAIDRHSAVVVNEAFVEEMGWSDPINKTFPLDSVTRRVIGVVQDFNYSDNFYNSIEPYIFTGVADEDIRYLIVRSEQGLMELDNTLKSTWLDVSPNEPYDRDFQEDVFDDYIRSTRADMTLMLVITTVALFLACLGLYGLIAVSIQGKLKEFGVRKVLGAAPRVIARIAGKQYVWVVTIAFLLGAPLGAWGIVSLVDQIYPVHKPLTVNPFLAALLVVGATMVITVLGQVRKAVSVNPASILRSE